MATLAMLAAPLLSQEDDEAAAATDSAQDREFSLRHQPAEDIAATLVARAGLRQLRWITSLDISGTGLRALPDIDWATAMPRLRLLDASRNALAALPKALPATITHLALQDNVLTVLPPAVFDLPALVRLSVGGNRLIVLDGPFERLPALRMLYAGCNIIQFVGDGLAGAAATLEVLYLSGNRLTSLPVVVTTLRRLAVLHISHNAIESLPPTVAQLQELHVLHLHSNRLSTLPVELLALLKLRQLSIRDNPLVSTFADEYAVMVPSLRDIASRLVHDHLQAHPEQSAGWQAIVPASVWTYLQSAQACSSCGGVCFGQHRIAQIDFVDLCGQYHVPLMRYLCSTTCPEAKPTAAPAPTADPLMHAARLRRVLLNHYSPDKVPPLEVLRQQLLDAEQEAADLGV